MSQKQNEIVVITGAASGIGLAIAKKYLSLKATVVALDLNSEALEQMEEGIQSYVVDVTQEAELLSVAQKIVEEVGKPTIWINNAGIAILGPFDKITSKDFSRVMAVNFDGVVFGTRAAISVMKEPVRGNIVNLASVSGIVPAPYISPYVAAKHAVVGFTRALQQELEHTHSPLKVTLVSPGFVKTKLMAPQGGIEFPEWLQWMVDEPEAVASEIIRGISHGKREINPTVHGRFLLRMHRFAPDLVAKSSKLIVAKNWKELLGFLPIRK